MQPLAATLAAPVATTWVRRTMIAVACAGAALLAGCGSSTTESAFTPDRLIAFGDGFTDAGQNGSRYTINDASINNWTLRMAEHYQLSLQPSASGGLSYAQGNARIASTPDAAGNPNTPSVAQQIDQFLANHSPQGGDLVLLNGGVSELITLMGHYRSQQLSDEQLLTAARNAGETLASQVRRLSDAGAQHILVTGSYDLSRTPWGHSLSDAQRELLHEAVQRFNDGLLVRIADLQKTVAFVDIAYYVNLFIGSSNGYGFDNADTPACTSIDAGPGIGIGNGEINAALCTSATLQPGINTDRYIFADKVHLSPAVHRELGNYAYDRLRLRW